MSKDRSSTVRHRQRGTNKQQISISTETKTDKTTKFNYPVKICTIK